MIDNVKNKIKKAIDTATGSIINLGIIGTGRIAERFVKECREVRKLNICAVYNIRRESSERFSKNQKIKDFYDDLEEFFSKVDAVYIASPHETHYNYAKEALDHGKHVICEKPIALKKSEAEELYYLAENKGLVLIEALKTAFMDGFMAMTNAAIGGAVGEVHDIEATFTKLESPFSRELNDLRYGGSFTELGSYVMLPIFRIYGTDPKYIRFQSVYAENGLDIYTKAIFDFGEGRYATAKCGLGVKSEGDIVISGTTGYIMRESPWWLLDSYKVRYEDPGRIDEKKFKLVAGGLCHEAGFFVKFIEEVRNNDYSSIEDRNRLRKESIARAGVMELFLEENRERREASIREEEKNPVRIWAHRGMSYAYPENTLEAFKAAAELGKGLAGIETDIQLSKDNEIMVFHDETLDRVTDGKGNLRDYTLAELKQFKIKSVNGETTTIPTLREMLELLKPYMEKNGLMINIELKTSVYRYQGLEELALSMVKEYGVEDKIVWSSFLMESVKHMKELDTSAKTGMLASRISDCIKGADEANADALHPSCYSLDTEVPEKYRGNVRAWGGQEPLFIQGIEAKLVEKNMKRFSRKGVSDIITNVPERYI